MPNTRLPEVIQYNLSPVEDFVFRSLVIIGIGVLNGQHSTADVRAIRNRLKTLMPRENCRAAFESILAKVQAREATADDVEAVIAIWGPE